MDSSAPKRRKTSPASSVPVGVSSAPPTSDGSARRSTRRRVPSFASPTKASLARSNPDILERRNASRPSDLIDAPAASEAGSPMADESDAFLRGESIAEQTEGGAETTNRDAQLTQYSSTGQPRSPTRHARGAMASKPRRTPNRPSPRPLPPPSADEEELINPFRGRVLRRSPPPDAPLQEEPELPPTPTQKGISDPASVHTSPMGIHNTPTKRPRRSKALAERIKSSPLKQPPLRPPDQVREFAREDSPSQTAKQRLRAQPQSRKRKRKVYPARHVEEIDPLAERKGVRDALLAEVARLKADVELATRENNDTYQLHREKKPSSTQRRPEDEDGLLDLLRRHALPPEKEVALDPMQDWIEVAMNPISLLPFGKTNGLLPSLFAPQQENADERAEQPPPSHHPVPMTMSEELPYLQVFTPLTFTSAVSILPRNDPASAGPVMQKHIISASSTVPGLFAARIEMTVNTKSLSIAELSVPHLEPSAVSELGPFVEMIMRDSGTSALRRNISVMTWAMSEWLRVAMRRARFWCTVERDLLSKEGLARCARGRRKCIKRKRVGRPSSTEEDSDDGGNRPSAQADQAPFAKADTLPHLGRTFLDLELSNMDGPEESPSVRIQWHIKFDWTGEAQSKLGLLIEVPAKWHGHDVRGSLTNIPDMFGKLVQEDRDPMEALRTVIALLVGEN
ncbi:hypothetical protein F4820DRAFT_453209 [Hypoxylon rubiginosum]|uniref:Uncharacterized protein n=1 Tax=Hypoxylon rubiginosum TaxID=110542 RepID=A0ACB9YLQ3_9PEZI|nr:hypothetical protein F4820DRAFT_453209 [Hypoxylon rubiginosum]